MTRARRHRPRHQPRMSPDEMLARLPRAFQPRLRRDQLLDLGLVHNENLDAIASGQAEPSMLWDFLGGVLLWHRAATLLGVGVDEMAPQIEVATRLVERYSRTGRVAFDGPDYQLAKIGVALMDALASVVDRPTAIAAAEWSGAECDRIAAAVVDAQQQRAAA
jgi:hypothetical protein